MTKGIGISWKPILKDILMLHSVMEFVLIVLKNTIQILMYMRSRKAKDISMLLKIFNNFQGRALVLLVFAGTFRAIILGDTIIKQ